MKTSIELFKKLLRTCETGSQVERLIFWFKHEGSISLEEWYTLTDDMGKCLYNLTSLGNVALKSKKGY